MDGLECSEMMLSEVCLDNDTLRIDAEYFQKRYISISNTLKEKTSTSLTELVLKIDVGFVGSMTSEYTSRESGICLLQTQNIEEFHVSMNNTKYINPQFHTRLKKSQIHFEDILIARSGSFGKTSIFLYDMACNSSDIIISHAKENVSPYYIVTFLNSKYGVSQLNRFASGGLQGHVNLTILESLRVWLPQKNEIPQLIERLITESKSLLVKSEHAYAVAQGHLNSAFDSLQPSIPNLSIAIKYFSKSFSMSGRLDAEYYQPKYDALLSLLSTLPTMKLGELASFKKSIEPGSDTYSSEGIPFIRVSDISKWGITMPAIHIPSNLVADIDALYPKKDTILFSKDGSMGLAYKIEKDLEAVTSGALLHITVKNSAIILPDYLTLVLNSPIVKLQAERDASGAIIQHWKPSDIEKVVIPVLDSNIQKTISDSVQKSFFLRRQSDKLLDRAKRAVEIAIEQSEESAVNWLKAVSNIEEIE